MTVSGSSDRRATAPKRTTALREAAGSVVQGLYRLVKGCLLHSDATNESVTVSARGVLDAIQDFCRHGAIEDVSILFMGDAVFVNGAILRTSREAHAIALELGSLLGACNVGELLLERTVGMTEITTLGTRLANVWRDRSQGSRFGDTQIPGITTRAVKALSDEVSGEDLSPATRVARTYAVAIMSVRSMLASVQKGELHLPRRIKRVAQKIVAHADEDGRRLVALAAMGGASVDPATVAVGSAILTVAMARQLTNERVLLANAAMGAMLFDAGRVKLGAGPGGVVRTLNDDELDAVAACSMVTLTAMGKLHSPARLRAVLVYEAWAQRRAHRTGSLYKGRRTQTVLSRILGVARAFCELRAAGAEGALGIDDAIQVLMNRAADANESAFVRLLVGALGIFPAGTMVELNTGELAVVMATPPLPIDFIRPPVKIMYDREARLLGAPFDVDLAAPPPEGHPRRFISRAVNADDQQLKAMRAFVVAATDATRRVAQAPTVSTKPSPPPRPAELPPPPPSSSPLLRPTAPAMASTPPLRPTVPVMPKSSARRLPSAELAEAPPQIAPTDPTKEVSWQEYAERLANSTPPPRAAFRPTPAAAPAPPAEPGRRVRPPLSRTDSSPPPRMEETLRRTPDPKPVAPRREAHGRTTPASRNQPPNRSGPPSRPLDPSRRDELLAAFLTDEDPPDSSSNGAKAPSHRNRQSPSKKPR